MKLKVRGGGEEAREADDNSERVSSEGIRAGPGLLVGFSSVSPGARAGTLTIPRGWVPIKW